MKKILKLIILLLIITILIAIFFCLRERTFLNVNNFNRDIVIENIKDYIITEKKFYNQAYSFEKDKEIKKVAYGREWSHGCIYVYHSLIDTKPYKLLILEGGEKQEALRNYIKENGYNEKDIWRWVILYSTISIFLCIINLSTKKKK